MKILLCYNFVVNRLKNYSIAINSFFFNLFYYYYLVFYLYKSVSTWRRIKKILTTFFVYASNLVDISTDEVNVLFISIWARVPVVVVAAHGVPEVAAGGQLPQPLVALLQEADAAEPVARQRGQRHLWECAEVRVPCHVPYNKFTELRHQPSQQT